ncbi:hypothetical protein HDU98_001413 [Podochytrium sp. JEL0797]|nr:hypothetical protein HDU98_001413 [Podochytrium sp. JEL0797]
MSTRRASRTAVEKTVSYIENSDSEDIPFAPPPPVAKRARKVTNPNAKKPGRKPKIPYLDKETKVAVEAVLSASKLCQSVFKALVTEETLTKKDKSPVTVADFGAQAIVNALLHKHFPEDPIVGEEDSKDLQADHTMRDRVLELVNGVVDEKMTAEQMMKLIDLGNYAGGSKGRFWTLDPIDGTKGFLRGEQFAVCLALVVDGTVELGIIGCPNLLVDLSKPDGERGCLFIGTRRHGAVTRTFTNETVTPIQTVKVDYAEETNFCESVEAGHSSQSEAAQIAKLLNITGDNNIRMDSQCKYGIVGRGDAGIYLRLPVSDTYEEKIWDHAGGMLVVQEAGGIVTDVDGNPLDFSVGRTLKNNKGVVAAGRAIHAEVLHAVRKVLKRPIPEGEESEEEEEEEEVEGGESEKKEEQQQEPEKKEEEQKEAEAAEQA